MKFWFCLNGTAMYPLKHLTKGRIINLQNNLNLFLTIDEAVVIWTWKLDLKKELENHLS